MNWRLLLIVALVVLMLVLWASGQHYGSIGQLPRAGGL